MDPIRLVTVHPALVHITLGTIPMLVLAYVLAAWRRSERWSFLGDVTLAVAALGTVVAAVFGLLAFLAVDWPGGLGFWRWLHLGGGLASTILLVTFAAVRFARRRRAPVASRGSAFAAVAIGVLAIATGWIGGEVLVFHAGVAVEAAAGGALAPPTRAHGRPADLDTAMHRIRESWSEITTAVATMVVDQPRDAAYADVERAAAELAEYARAAASFDEPAAVGSTVGRRWRVVAADVGEHEHGAPDPHGEGHGLGSMARELAQHARRLEVLARERRLPELARALGETTALCAHCHVETRW